MKADVKSLNTKKNKMATYVLEIKPMSRFQVDCQGPLIILLLFA